MKRVLSTIALCVCAMLCGVASPLMADVSGITTTPLSFPTFAVEATVGPDGSVWMLTSSGKLGKIAPGGAYTELPLPFGQPQGGAIIASGLATGIDGNLWITGLNGHIARVTPNGTATDFPIAASFNGGDVSIVNGADDALWFLYPRSPATVKLGRIDIYGSVTTYDLGFTDNITGLVSGGDGSLWFINTTKNQVVKFSIVSKSVAGAFPIPSASNKDGDNQMVAGPDGNVWFSRGSSIDRITPDGTITEFRVPSGGNPAGIAAGGDGNIWFTEPVSAKLGQLEVASITSGGTAIVNETNASLDDAYELFAFPGKFTSVAGKTAVLDANHCDPLASPCPPITFLVRVSPRSVTTSNMKAVSAPAPTACADVAIRLSFASLVETPFERPDLREATTIAGIDLTNDGPYDAENVTVIFKASTGDGSRIDLVDKGTFDSVSIGADRLSVTLTKTSMTCGSTDLANVRFSKLPPTEPPPVSGTSVVFSGTADPKPSNNTSASRSSQADPRFVLNPVISEIVVTQVGRGK